MVPRNISWRGHQENPVDGIFPEPDRSLFPTVRAQRWSPSHHTPRPAQFHILQTHISLYSTVDTPHPSRLNQYLRSWPYNPRRSWQRNNSLMLNDTRWKTARLLPTRFLSIFILRATWNSVNIVGSFDRVGGGRLTHMTTAQQRSQEQAQLTVLSRTTPRYYRHTAFIQHEETAFSLYIHSSDFQWFRFSNELYQATCENNPLHSDFTALHLRQNDWRLNNWFITLPQFLFLRYN